MQAVAFATSEILNGGNLSVVCGERGVIDTRCREGRGKRVVMEWTDDGLSWLNWEERSREGLR